MMTMTVVARSGVLVARVANSEGIVTTPLVITYSTHKTEHYTITFDSYTTT